MRTMVKVTPNQRIPRIAFCDFETIHHLDLEAHGVDVRVVGKEVHVFEDGKDTKKKPTVAVKCGAMVVWDREQDADIEIGMMDSPEIMILKWGDMDVDRAYFHNSRFDLSFFLAWFKSHPERKVITKSEYVTVGKQRIYLVSISKGKQGMLYSVKFRVEGERVEGKPTWKRTIEVWDSAKIWKDNLESIGIDFDPDGSKGLRKGATTGGSQACVVGCPPELREYCMQDCRVEAYAMKYYINEVEKFCGQPNGFMTAAATTYNMALYWLHKNKMTNPGADDKKLIKKWVAHLKPEEREEIKGNEAVYYYDKWVDWTLPKLETSDLRRRIKNPDGSWAVDSDGKKLYKTYDKVDKNGNVIRAGKGRYSWMREGYKGATPLLNWKMRYGRRGLCGEVVIKDVNSMFPTQLVRERMPWGKPIDIDAEECVRMMECPDSEFTWMAKMKVNMRVKKGHRGTFLKKHGKETAEDGFVTKALDIVDNIEGDEWISVCEPEWEMIIRDYDVLDMQIIEAVKFHTKVGLFAGYIMHWYDIKACAGKKWLDEEKTISNPGYNPALKAFAKLMINSFYGKFGSSPYMENHGYECVDGVLKDVLLEDETDEDNRYYLPLAIWTTAYARNLLSKGCNALGWDHVIYTDTDSWHIIGMSEDEATARLASIGVGNDEEKLGDAPTEQVCAHGAYIRPKGYMHFDADGKVVILKGKGWIYNEDGSVKYEGKKDSKDIKMAGANIFDGIDSVEDLKHTKVINGVKGIWAQRLTGFNVVGGVLLMKTWVNILEDTMISDPSVIIND